MKAVAVMVLAAPVTSVRVATEGVHVEAMVNPAVREALEVQDLMVKVEVRAVKVLQAVTMAAVDVVRVAVAHEAVAAKDDQVIDHQGSATVPTENRYFFLFLFIYVRFSLLFVYTSHFRPFSI